MSTAATEVRWQELTAIQELLSQFDREVIQWQAQFEGLLDEATEELQRGSTCHGQEKPLVELAREFVDDRHERRQRDADILTELQELRRLMQSPRGNT